MNKNFYNLDVDEQTREKWLSNGDMTQQFLNDPKLDRKMARAKNDRKKVKILYNYIHRHTVYPLPFLVSKKYKAKNKFQRDAGEIWRDKKMTGCTDYALVFSTLARKYGLPTTILDTVEQGCYNNIKDKKPVNNINGHAFCEVLVDGKWVLADPTFKITETNYDPQNIQLTGRHNVLGKQKFVPYTRSIDTQKKQSVKEHNQSMGEAILNEGTEKEPKTTSISQSEIEATGYYEEHKTNIDLKEQKKSKEPEKTNSQTRQMGE